LWLQLDFVCCFNIKTFSERVCAATLQEHRERIFLTIKALSESDSGGSTTPAPFIALQCTAAHRRGLNFWINSPNVSIKPITISLNS
jgi:hypothetical protein